MVERSRPGQANQSGQVLGCAVSDKIQIAVLDVESGKLRDCEFLTFVSPHEVLSAFVERPRPRGIGTAEWLAFGTGHIGWRPADYWIHEAPFHPTGPADEFPFYFGPFQSAGSPTLAAIVLLIALRRRWPDLPAAETTPLEYYAHLARTADSHQLDARVARIAGWLGVELPPALGKAEWEAAMSAYATWMGLRGDWSIDLFRLQRRGGMCTKYIMEQGRTVEESWYDPPLSYERLIFPAGPVSFFWPPDERAKTWINEGSTV